MRSRAFTAATGLSHPTVLDLADAFYAGYGSSGPSSDEDHAVDVESYPGYGPPNLGFTDNE